MISPSGEDTLEQCHLCWRLHHIKSNFPTIKINETFASNLRPKRRTINHRAELSLFVRFTPYNRYTLVIWPANLWFWFWELTHHQEAIPHPFHLSISVENAAKCIVEFIRLFITSEPKVPEVSARKVFSHTILSCCWVERTNVFKVSSFSSPQLIC